MRRQEDEKMKKEGGDFMKRKIYSILGNICYHIRLNGACSYFFDKADEIAEAEYTEDVIDFYENGKGYYGK